jgi:hypothetical protein
MTETTKLPDLRDLLLSTPTQRELQRRRTGSATYWNWHDCVVRHYFQGTRTGLRDGENRILCLLDALHGYAREACGYTTPHVVQPISDAIGDALSTELGRLDGGKLSSAHHAIIDWVEAQGFEITR